ncbi:MAG: DUF1499 domain-containing protein [Gammaproteobacteria bacterium]|jgi:uncharacterized protein (DUF1499 family)|nr:DUF1499 domain-containing protein [Gammaproteobacteria bacterium]
MTKTNTPGALINWTGYIAVTLLLLLPVSVLTVRSGAWQQGLLLYALSCLGCVLVLGLCGVLLLLPRYANTRGAILGRMLVALPGAVLLISLLAGRGDYPPIHDVTTDIKDPPVFTMAMAQRPEGANSLEIDPQAISAQQEAYPDVQTIRTSLDIEAAFDRALAVAGDLGWDIYHQDRNAGVIEAVETTAIMAFKDDIVIRLRSNAQGTKVDLRSVSRVGIGDIGANAKRIRAFQQAFAP